MNTKIIAVINQKGGVGKSTTAQALTAGLFLKGYKVLAIDIDAQSNTTYSLGGRKDGATVLGLLLKEIKTADAIQHTKYGDLIAGNKGLAAAQTLLNDTGKEYRLTEALEDIKDNYDYIIIDAPPALSILTINALTAADSAIIPVQADIYSLQGVADLIDTIEPVKKYCNPKLEIGGLLFTRYNSRSAFNSELMDYAGKLARNVGTKIYKSTIREAISIRKAQANQVSIYDYDGSSKVAEEYRNFVEEIIAEREG